MFGKNNCIALLLLLSFSGCVPPAPLVLSPEQLAAKEQKLVSLLTIATQDLRANKLAPAEAALKLAQELSPDDPRVLDGLGCVAWRRGNYDLAEEFFKRALSQNGLYDRGYMHLAFIAAERGDSRAAEELLRISLQLNPLNFRARNNLAAELLDAGARPGARAEAYNELLIAIQSAQKADVVLGENLLRAQREE